MIKKLIFFSLIFQVITSNKQIEIDSFVTLPNEMFQTIHFNLMQKQKGDLINGTIKSKHKAFLSLSSEDKLREKELKKFLAYKYEQYMDEINMMSIPEYRVIYKDLITVLKPNYQNLNKLIIINNNSNHINKTCIKHEKLMFKLNEPMCSHTWLIIKRENLYPFKRGIAKCNCDKCQVNKINNYNSDHVSKCMPSNSLVPVLFKETIGSNMERWWFSLEEIPTSCHCLLGNY